MKCPFCGHSNTQVLDTRMSEEGDTVRRRRRCESCDRRFTTYERIELFFPAIVKKNGSREDYVRAKLKDSMRTALRKRPVSAEAIDDAITRIEEKLLSLGQKELLSSQVGELVMRELRKLDKIATSPLPRSTGASRTCRNSAKCWKRFPPARPARPERRLPSTLSLRASDCRRQRRLVAGVDASARQAGVGAGVDLVPALTQLRFTPCVTSE